MGQIIALSGWKQSGKDTSADLLIEQYGFKRLAFADTLKDMVAEQYGIPRGSCDNPSLKERALPGFLVSPKDSFSEMICKYMVREFRGSEGQKPNELVKFAGGWAGLTRTRDGLLDPEDLFPVYWTPRALCILEGSTKRTANSQYWVQRALSRLDPDGCYVITDMRYRSEAEQVAQIGRELGMAVDIVRIHRWDAIDSTDSSERDLDDYAFTRVWENRGTVEEFRQGIREYMEDR